MTQLPSDDQVWAPCTPGSLARYASQHRGRRRRVAAAKIAGGSLVCVLAISIGWKLSHDGQLREFNFGGIACHEVQRLMPQYMMKELPAETSDKIQSHLAQCPMCQEIMRRMKQKEMEGQVGCADPNCLHQHERLGHFPSMAVLTPVGGGSRHHRAWLLTEATYRSDVRSRT
jgi:hypothetical protein